MIQTRRLASDGHGWGVSRRISWAAAAATAPLPAAAPQSHPQSQGRPAGPPTATQQVASLLESANAALHDERRMDQLLKQLDAHRVRALSAIGVLRRPAPLTRANMLQIRQDTVRSIGVRRVFLHVRDRVAEVKKCEPT